MLAKARMLLSLGLRNSLSVCVYRLQLKLGRFIKKMPQESIELITLSVVCSQKQNIFFESVVELPLENYFFKHSRGTHHTWQNPFNGSDNSHNANKHWSRLNSFEGIGNDIKVMWEPSRFYWFTDLARAYATSGDKAHLQSLQSKLNNWLEQYPWNTSYGWSCAQEAAIRLVNIVLGLQIAGVEFSDAIFDLIDKHCRRIIPVMHYASAQQNNHATSEAAGLWISGCYCLSKSLSRAQEKKVESWLKKGRKALEKQLKRLVMSDGTFAQYSVTYHRLVLDTISLCEVFRREQSLGLFSDLFYQKYQLLFDWLYQMTDAESGDAPNLGANDGTALFKLDCCDYRDFRPTLQVASVLLRKCKCFKEGVWDEPLFWLGMNSVKRYQSVVKQSQEMKQGGFVSIVLPKGQYLLRYANFKFRPSQADCFHIDLWHKGVNLLRDGGSYSYNAEPELMDYYTGTTSHNTIEFDGHNQMPKISRFLFGHWLKTKVLQSLVERSGVWHWAGEYKDKWGCVHRRSLEASKKQIIARDSISGYRDEATLRWRLAPLDWCVSSEGIDSELAEISVKVNQKPIVLSLATERESRYYLDQSEIPALRVSIPAPKAEVETRIILH